MKKNIILSVMIVLVIIACTLFMRDGFIYLVTSLMALVIMGAIRRNRSRVLQMTRWAKAHPKKAQVFITVVQIALMALGIIAGYNFKELGYNLSGTTVYVFSAIMVMGFLFVPFLPKRSIIVIPKVVNKHRFAYIGIALSSFVLMVLYGNRMGDRFPNSPITLAVKAIDHAIFPVNVTDNAGYNTSVPKEFLGKNSGHTSMNASSNGVVFASYTDNEEETIITPAELKKEAKANLKAGKKATRLEKRKARMMNRIEKFRLAFAGGISAGAVILIILLIGTLCAGICLIIGGISGGSAGLIPLGVIVAGGSIWGMIKVGGGGKRKNEVQP